MFQLSHVCYLGALASVGGRVLGGDGSHCVGVGLEAVEMNHLFRTFLIRYIAVWPVPGKVPSKAGDFPLGTVAILYPLVQMGSHGSIAPFVCLAGVPSSLGHCDMLLRGYSAAVLHIVYVCLCRDSVGHTSIYPGLSSIH